MTEQELPIQSTKIMLCTCWSEDDNDYCPCCGELGLPITGNKLANMIRAVLGEP